MNTGNPIEDVDGSVRGASDLRSFERKGSCSHARTVSPWGMATPEQQGWKSTYLENTDADQVEGLLWALWVAEFQAARGEMVYWASLAEALFALADSQISTSIDLLDCHLATVDLQHSIARSCKTTNVDAALVAAFPEADKRATQARNQGFGHMVAGDKRTVASEAAAGDYSESEEFLEHAVQDSHSHSTRTYWQSRT